MTEYEREVLRAILEGGGRYGWYKIEQRLSSVSLLERGHLPSVLGAFVDRGWVERAFAEDKEIYSITESGRLALAS